MKLHEETRTAEDGRTIRFSVRYSKELHAYRVTACPVTTRALSNGLQITEFGALTGFNDTLLQADRQSSKRLATALQTLEEKMPKYMAYFSNQKPATV